MRQKISKRVAISIFIFLLVIIGLRLVQRYGISFTDLGYVIKKELLDVSSLSDFESIPAARKCGVDDSRRWRLPDVPLPSFCAVQVTDQLLASRCRGYGSHGSEGESSLAQARKAFAAVPGRRNDVGVLKYDNKDCESGLGLWRDNWLSGGYHKHKCVLVTVGEKLDLRRGILTPF